jgi:hypothetical protein
MHSCSMKCTECCNCIHAVCIAHTAAIPLMQYNMHILLHSRRLSFMHELYAAIAMCPQHAFMQYEMHTVLQSRLLIQTNPWSAALASLHTYRTCSVNVYRWILQKYVHVCVYILTDECVIHNAAIATIDDCDMHALYACMQYAMQCTCNAIHI